jgi:hypothetical protein
MEHGLGRRLDPETPRAVALYPIATAATDRVRRTWGQDGAWLDQGRTGTCVGHAFAHRRADGPVKVSGVDSDFARTLYLEASAIYWGEPDASLQKGTSAVSACQVLLRRGVIDGYEWVSLGTAGPEDLRYALLELGAVCVGSNWYQSMYSPVPKGDQFYMKVNYSSTMVGGHEYVVNAIDLDPADGSEPYYRIKNSWGKGWGKGGTARFRIADLERLIFEGYGDAVLPHELPNA